MKFKNDYNGFTERHSDFIRDYLGKVKLPIEFQPIEMGISIIGEKSSPFASNPITGLISYNSSSIEKCALSPLEEDACIMHELGHFRYHYNVYIKNSEKECSELEKEIKCDNVAVEADLAISLLSALCKMQEKINVNYLNERISFLAQNIKIYRPEWTCGRYSKKGEVAIFYNLLDGMSYLFEDYSALVISKLLEIPRNGSFSLIELSKTTDITIESIQPFMNNLFELGLVVKHIPNQEEIAAYRRNLSEFRKKQSATTVKTTQEKLPMAVFTTEMDYTAKAGGITTVMFELTYRCSEKCIHCYNIGATRNNEEISHRGDLMEMTLDDYKRIIDQLYEEGLIKVCLSGGDPFSKSIVWDIIDYLHEKEIAINIFTNGLNVENEIERLSNYYPQLVGVSLYSGIPEIHDKITRVKGSWKRSVNVIKQLSDLSVPVILKCCVMRPNVQDYYTVLDVAKELGIMQVQYELNVSDSIEGDKCVSHFLRLTPQMLDIVLQDDNTPMYVGKEAPNYGGQPRNMNVNACGAGTNGFCITPDGNLIPCCALHLIFGNLKQSSLSEILKKSKTLQYWNNLTLDQYEECGRHNYCDYCNLCPGINFSEHGIVEKAGENNCYMAKCRWSLAQKLMNGDSPIEKDKLKDFLNCFSNEINKISKV